LLEISDIDKLKFKNVMTFPEFGPQKAQIGANRELHWWGLKPFDTFNKIHPPSSCIKQKYYLMNIYIYYKLGN